MKKLYMVGGTMGAGKTAVCQQLKKQLPDSVFLDGDWCWDADPFQVTEETKRMVNEKNLKKRLEQDIVKGIRTEDVIERSVRRISLYENLNTIKVDTNNKTIPEIAEEISIMGRNLLTN